MSVLPSSPGDAALGSEAGVDLADRPPATTALPPAHLEPSAPHTSVGPSPELLLRKSNQRLELLSEVAGQLLASPEPQSVINALCQRVLAFLDCEVFFNYLVDDRRGCLRLNACGGVPEDVARRIEWLDYGAAVCGCAARDGRRIVAEDIPTTPDPRTDLVKGLGVQAYACHPLLSQGTVLGTLSFGTRTRTRFAADELALMKAVADHIALAMQRLRHEQALHELNQQLAAQSQRFDAVLSSVQDFLYVLDTRGRFAFANKVLLDLWGLSEAQAAGKTMRELAYPPEVERVLMDGVRDVVATGTTVRSETRYTSPTGAGGWFENILSPVRGPGGHIQWVAGASRDVTDRKRAEAALRQSEERYRTLFGTLIEGFCIIEVLFDAHGTANDYRFLEINPAFEAQSGLREARGRRIRELAPALEAHWFEIFGNVALTGEPARFVNQAKSLNRWYDVSAYRVGGPDSRKVAVLFNDVTDRRNAAEAERAIAARLRTVLDNSRDGINMLDLRTGRYVFMSPAQVRLTGFTEEELRDLSVEDAYQRVHPDDRQVSIAQHQQAVAGRDGTTVEYRWKVKGGEYRWFSDSRKVVRDAQGRAVALVGVSRDITDQKRAEEALRQRDEQFGALIGNLHVGVALVDEQGRFAVYNPVFLRMFGLSSDVGNVNDQDWSRWQVFAEDGTPLPVDEHPVRVAAFTGRPVRNKLVRVKLPSGGDDVWMLISAEPLLTPEGKVRLMICTYYDITDRKRAEDELKAAKVNAERAKVVAEAASAAKDQFLAVLSHELRTPLTPVSAAAHLLETQESLSADQRDLVGMIRRNVDLEARLIDDLLDLTRISRGKLELHVDTVDVHERIRHVVEMVGSDAAARKLRLIVQARAQRHHVRADAARLQQILWNVLKNAVKFTPVGGHITVRTDNPGSGTVAVSVQDTGIGIEPDVMGRIFDAFEQGSKDVNRQFGGLGLGLAISKGLTDLHGGTLTANSPGRGRGATFTLSLPVATTPPRGQPATGGGTAAGLPSADATCRLLLVEDNADTAKLMARLLRGHGYEVIVADSVASALRAAEAHSFALLVSDIGLPDGSGLDLMRQLQARYGLTGIALSGFGMEEDVRRSREAGFAAHMTKPVNVQKLQAAIRAVLG